LHVQHAIHPVEPHWYDWNVETRRHHPDATAERFDVPGGGALTLRKDQNRPAAAKQFACVGQDLPCPDLALRKGERVEVERGDVVVDSIGKPLLPGVPGWKEMRLEEFLRHGGRAACWERRGAGGQRV